MGKEIVIQVEEAQRVPHRKNARRNTPRHILIKLSKIDTNEDISTEKGNHRFTTKTYGSPNGKV